MATALGVTEQTIETYLAAGPNDEVRKQMDNVEAEVRLVAVQELKDQLRRAGHRSRTAEQPVKVWTDENGNLNVREQRDDETDELQGRYAVPNDIEMGPDHSARYFRREEVREILSLLCDITGAGEPDQLEISASDAMWDDLTEYYDDE
jgi:hypothetical protein